jgi:hypothetical protein
MMKRQPTQPPCSGMLAPPSKNTSEQVPKISSSRIARRSSFQSAHPSSCTAFAAASMSSMAGIPLPLAGEHLTASTL